VALREQQMHNRLRRDELAAEFVADYRPETPRLRAMCAQFAAIVEQLEVLKPGSTEHQRLVVLSQTLGDALEASRRPPCTLDALDDLSPSELADRADQLARAARQFAEDDAAR